MSVGDGKDGDEDAMGEEPGDSFDSRRRDRRASLVLPLEYRNAGHLLVSYCTNLSRGGLFLPTPEPLPVGATVTLVLRVPNRDRPVTLEAKLALDLWYVRHAGLATDLRIIVLTVRMIVQGERIRWDVIEAARTALATT